jgi:hypothetical protein
MAIPIDVVLARRIACARLVVRGDDVRCVDDLRRGREIRVVLQTLANLRLVADEDELHAFESTARTRDAGEHHRDPLVAAHRIDGDSRNSSCRHAPARLAQPSTETISRPL